MRFITFVRQMFTSHSGISSKRVCGVIGWFVAVVVLIYCTIMCIQAPLMIDTFLICVMALLGIDSVTGIWKKFKSNEGNSEENRQHPKVTSSRAFVYSLSCYKILVDKIDTVLKKPLQTSDDDW